MRTGEIMTERAILTYLVSALPSGSWFVESDAGTSGYSFRSLAAAERFAVVLAQRNRPSKVCILGGRGEIIDETVFEETIERVS
jgi:hypothetical protein